MSKLPGTNVQKTVLAVCVLFIFLVALSIGQYQVISQHRKIVGISSRVLFQFTTVKEFVTRALLDKRYADLGETVGELEELNASVQGILQNPLIPDQLKGVLLNRLDLSGVAILVRQITSFAEPQKIARLQEEIRIAGEQILQFDRLLADHVKKKLVGYQSFVISMLLFAVLFLAQVCFFVYLRLISPLRNLKAYLSHLVEEPSSSVRQPKKCGWLQEIAISAQRLGQKYGEQRSKTELLGALLGDCPFPLVVCDRQGRIILQNRAANLTTVPSDAPAKGQVAALLSDERSRQHFGEGLAWLVEHPSGKKHLRLSLGGCEEMVTMFDLAELENEALFGMVWQQKEDRPGFEDKMPFSFRLALLGQLTCGVAHEIGDAVNSLLNYQDLALDSLNDRQNGAESKSMLRAAAVEGEKIAQRTRLLLETSQFRTKSDTFHVAQLVNETINLVRNQMKSEGVRIDTFLPPDLPPVQGCFGMARLVCIEILLFVGELFAPFSEKRIEVRAIPCSEKGKRLVRLVIGSPVQDRYLLPDMEKPPHDGEKENQVSSWQCLVLLQEYLRREGGEVHFANREEGPTVQVDFPAAT